MPDPRAAGFDMTGITGGGAVSADERIGRVVAHSVGCRHKGPSGVAIETVGMTVYKLPAVLVFVTGLAVLFKTFISAFMRVRVFRFIRDTRHVGAMALDAFGLIVGHDQPKAGHRMLGFGHALVGQVPAKIVPAVAGFTAFDPLRKVRIIMTVRAAFAFDGTKNPALHRVCGDHLPGGHMTLAAFEVLMPAAERIKLVVIEKRCGHPFFLVMAGHAIKRSAFGMRIGVAGHAALREAKMRIVAYPS